MIEFTVEPPAAGGRLDRFLAERLTDTSRSRLARAIRDGRVTVNGVSVKPSTPLEPGDRIAVEPPSTPPQGLAPEPVPLKLVYVDAHVVVVDKPAGVVVHPGAGNSTGTLVHGVLHEVGELSPVGAPDRPGVVHRIDAGTSGLLVLARTEPAHHHLAAQFAAHAVDRRYHALAWDHGLPDEGTWRSSHYGRAGNDRRKFTGASAGGKHAVTHWQVLERLPPCARVEFSLETGRTHQIRVHASEAGHPLVGDVTYGRRRRIDRPQALRVLGPELGLTRQALHAAVLGFEHPATGARLRFESPWPDDLSAALDALRAAWASPAGV